MKVATLPIGYADGVDRKLSNKEKFFLEKYKVCIKDLLNHEVFKNISKAKTYHEHEFYYNEYHGIIDLLCIYDDHVDIIDYKLSDISKEEYVRQLNIYKEYVSSKTNKQINCYLLSILRKEIKEI